MAGRGPYGIDRSWHDEAKALFLGGMNATAVSRALGHPTRHRVRSMLSYYGVTRKRPISIKPFVSVKQVLAALCETAGASLEEIKSQKRTQELSFRRFYVINGLRERGYSMLRIGGLVNRDHTSVIHALKRFPESVYQWHTPAPDDRLSDRYDHFEAPARIAAE